MAVTANTSFMFGLIRVRSSRPGLIDMPPMQADAEYGNGCDQE